MSLQMSKEDLLMPVRSDSSCSLGKLSVDLSELSERQRLGDERGHVTRDNCHADVTRDTLCDTSSEVSDEGYKSSQGNVSAKTEENTLRLNRENTDVSVNEGEYVHTYRVFRNNRPKIMPLNASSKKFILCF